MNNNTFSKSDILASLIIGEILAWLLIALAKSLGIAIPFVWILPVVLPILCVAGLYIAFLIGRKIPVFYQIGKFILVGGFNTLVDWGVLALMIFIFRQYFLAEPQDIFVGIFAFSLTFYSLYKAISFVAAATNSYLWNKFWTFKRETTENMGKEFAQFFTVTVVGFLVNVGIATSIFNYITPIGGLNYDQWGIVAAVFATIFSMFWNFIGYKFIVFDSKGDTDIQMARG